MTCPLVKNIGCASQNIGGQKVLKSDKCMAFLNYWGQVPWLPPNVYAYVLIQRVIEVKLRSNFHKVRGDRVAAGSRYGREWEDGRSNE